MPRRTSSFVVTVVHTTQGSFDNSGASACGDLILRLRCRFAPVRADRARNTLARLRRTGSIEPWTWRRGSRCRRSRPAGTRFRATSTRRAWACPPARPPRAMRSAVDDWQAGRATAPGYDRYVEASRADYARLAGTRPERVAIGVAGVRARRDRRLRRAGRRRGGLRRRGLHLRRLPLPRPRRPAA